MASINQLNLNGTDYDIEAKDFSESGGIATALDGKANKTDLDGKSDVDHKHAIADVNGLQAALDGKATAITGAATTIVSSNLTANRAVISNGSGKVAVSAVTATELGYLSGVTSSVQTQLNAKASGAALTQEITDRGDAVKAVNARIDGLDLSKVGGNTSQFIYGIKQENGAVTADVASWVTSVTDDTNTAKPATAGAMVSYVKGKIAGAFKLLGSKTVAQIKALDVTTIAVGSVYNMSDSGTIEYTLAGVKKSLKVITGDNIAWTDAGWDALSGFVDLSGYATTSALNTAINTEATTRKNADDTLDGKITTLSGRVTTVENAKHTHNNKDVLDNTSASFTTTLKTKLDGVSTGANKLTITVSGTKATFTIA